MQSQQGILTGGVDRPFGSLVVFFRRGQSDPRLDEASRATDHRDYTRG